LFHHGSRGPDIRSGRAERRGQDNLSQIVSLTTGPVDGPVYTLTILSLAVPLLFGMFWGSPAVARERETGTVQFAWTQSVTRRRWLSVKTGWLLLAGAVFGSAVAGLVTWWYAPLNALHQNQFQQGWFDLQGIVPIGYAVFAVALGIAAGDADRPVAAGARGNRRRVPRRSPGGHVLGAGALHARRHHYLQRDPELHSEGGVLAARAGCGTARRPADYQPDR